MTSLTPIVRRILLLWIGVWLASVVAHLLSVPLDIFRFQPQWVLSGEISAIFGLFSYPFFHDPGGFLHLFFNGWVFAFFAPEMERLYPGRKFVQFLFLALLLGALGHLLVTFLVPALGFSVLGGSGLAMAALGAFTAHFPQARLNLFLLEVRVLVVFGVICALDALSLTAAMAGKANMIASDVHLMGAVCGWFWAKYHISGWNIPGQQSIRKWKNRQTQQRNQAATLELDRILAKIGQSGIGSLTKREKKFLEKESHKGR